MYRELKDQVNQCFESVSGMDPDSIRSADPDPDTVGQN
jgi:hypothetical protein